jgi:hypothetical protein
MNEDKINRITDSGEFSDSAFLDYVKMKRKACSGFMTFTEIKQKFHWYYEAISKVNDVFSSLDSYPVILRTETGKFFLDRFVFCNETLTIAMIDIDKFNEKYQNSSVNDIILNNPSVELKFSLLEKELPSDIIVKSRHIPFRLSVDSDHDTVKFGSLGSDRFGDYSINSDTMANDFEEMKNILMRVVSEFSISKE